MDIELTYRRGLLRSIGGVQVSYGPREWLDSTPRALGAWPLEYQRFSTMLRSVAGIQITYRRWTALPLSVGQWNCEHSRFGSRMLRLGPYELSHDRGGSRVRTLGPLEISYDRLGSRPIRAHLPGETAQLSPDLLLALFLTLFWQQQSWEAAQRSRS
ncbi:MULTISPECIES: hypothetical protein [unclassified Streptomyces]|jgi:hypothetical protein|uniref:hypothetical protein n=1 Tax=unclassified Streptomyces TaxID=2593676 RepID=UPI000F4DA60A|nr:MULTISPECIES: hypothetical protein [unclassified Streptomyces]MDH6451087.1 hypothetical protein [Streptomyces sp. SAI-119]MDH6498358.1 hypothetical protein [Streptomyces sp. SAI-149]QUC62801.1 hypothetical protein IOD14_41910 [Streptomyces sp. A2-16]